MWRLSSYNLKVIVGGIHLPPSGGVPSVNSFKGSGKLFYKGSGLGFTFIHSDKVKQIHRKSKKISSFDELQYRKK